MSVEWICQECGAKLSGEELVEGKEPHGEVVYSCPNCGCTEKEEAFECKFCRDFFTKDELCEGLCNDCLSEEVDYDLILNFLIEKKLLAKFMFENFYESVVECYFVDSSLLRDLKTIFLREKANDTLMNRDDFLKKIKYFLFDKNSDVKADYVKYLIENY